MGTRAPRVTRVKVDTVRYTQAGVEVPIYYEKIGETFSGTVLGTEYTNKDAAVVKKEVLAAVIESYRLEWLGVIQVRLAHPGGRGSGGFMLEVNRYWAAQSKKSLKRADWRYDKLEDRQAYCKEFYWPADNGPFMLPWTPLYNERRYSFLDGGDLYYLPYTEELWTGLEQLQQALRTLEDQVKTLLGTTDGLLRLVEQGVQHLLPAPAAPPEEGQ